MITLIGTALGFLTSFLPSVLNFFEAKADRAHELAIMDKQAAIMQLQHGQKMAEIEIEGDIREMEALHEHDQPTGVTFIDGLRGSVRPVITYCFFALFCFVEVSAYLALIAANITASDALVIIWDDEVMALFSAIMAFWFGGRQINKRLSGR